MANSLVSFIIRHLWLSQTETDFLLRHRTLLRFLFVAYQIGSGRPDADPEFLAIKNNSIIQYGDCVLEIGSNKGGMTSHILSMVGELGQVYACEPNPFSFEYSALALRKYQNLKVLNIGVSDKTSEGFLELGGPTDKGARIMGYKSRGPYRVTGCKFVTLDYLVGSLLGRTPNVILIDVEGAELRVLEGGAMTLRTLKPLRIVMELHPTVTLGAIEDTTRILKSLGYTGEILYKSVETSTYLFSKESSKKSILLN